MRLFKWVVSFATWKYGVDSTINVTSGIISSNVIDDKIQNLQGYGFVPSPTRSLAATKLAPDHTSRKVVSNIEEKLSSKVNISFFLIIYFISFKNKFCFRLKIYLLDQKYIVKENLRLKHQPIYLN